MQNMSRKEVNTALCNLETVSGEYYGVQYSGKVTGNRGVTVSPYDIEISVQLDYPITVFSWENKTITINGGDVYKSLYSSKPTHTVNELAEGLSKYNSKVAEFWDSKK